MSEQQNSVWKMIQDLSNKKGISEIVINGPKNIFVERSGQFIQLDVQLSKNDIYEFCHDIASYNKKVFDKEHLILDGNLPDGSRVNLVGEPISKGSPAVSIRKYLNFIKSFDENPDIFGLGHDWIDFFKALISARMNIIVSGGTGVGKTTFLNLLLRELSPAERVVTIEDTIEISLSLPNVVRLEASGQQKLTMSDLVKNTLRMRPDRIIIGEVRGGELFDLLQAMNTGHEGSMSSIHANNTGECLNRMENLFLMSGFDLPFHVVRKQMALGIDFIVQLNRDREGNRIISQITEVTGMEANTVLTQDIALAEDGPLLKTGLSPQNRRKLEKMGGLRPDFFNS
jgi:pilus assembly protein CpaF